MRHSNRPKAAVPARFRQECESSDKQTVARHSKTKDLRDKLDKHKKRKSKLGKPRTNNNKERDGSMDELDEGNFSPDYETEMSVDEANEDDDTQSETEKDQNNNAQRLKSVVVEASTSNSPRTVSQIRQRISFNNSSETEDGEILSSDNGEKSSGSKNAKQFFEDPDDEQLMQFLKRHQDRIKKITEKELANDKGEDNFLTENIRRMSIVDRQGGVVCNNQSEDTIYSRLVQERHHFEQTRDNGSNSDKQNQRDQPQQIHSNMDSSLDTSESSSPNEVSNRESENLTDETDKGIIMDKFVNSPPVVNMQNGSNSGNQVDNVNTCLIAGVDDTSPPDQRDKARGKRESQLKSIPRESREKLDEMRNEKKRHKGRGKEKGNMKIDVQGPRIKEEEWTRKTKIQKLLCQRRQVSPIR